jgi:hypothetical protein
MSSWPRTGNSFFRRFIELCTGVYTGSDMKLAMTLPLQMGGMLGEQHVGSNSVWITKTHAPMWNEDSKFTADKNIVITRNPIEVFPSMASLINTSSHTLELEKPID